MKVAAERKRRGDAGDEVDRRVGRDAQILGDAVFGILVVAADEVELVVAAVGEPARQHRAGQPGAPAALDTHPREYLGYAEQHAADRQREEYGAEIEHGRGIALLDGIEDRAVPDVDAVLKADIADDQQQQPDRKCPRQAVAAPAPKTARADPESRQQIVLARLLGFFRRHLQIGLDKLWRRLDGLAILRVDLDNRRLFRSRFFCGRFRLHCGFGHGRITAEKSKGSSCRHLPAKRSNPSCREEHGLLRRGACHWARIRATLRRQRRLRGELWAEFNLLFPTTSACRICLPRR